MVVNKRNSSAVRKLLRPHRPKVGVRQGLLLNSQIQIHRYFPVGTTV